MKTKFSTPENREAATTPKVELFEVMGAGKIQVSQYAHCQCRGAVGFSIGVSWGRHGFTGGVIGRTEAKRLAEYILAKVAECPETEQEERQRLDEEFEIMLKNMK